MMVVGCASLRVLVYWSASGGEQLPPVSNRAEVYLLYPISPMWLPHPSHILPLLDCSGSNVLVAGGARHDARHGDPNSGRKALGLAIERKEEHERQLAEA